MNHKDTLSPKRRVLATSRVRALAEQELITRETKRSHKPEVCFCLRRSQATTAARTATATVPTTTATITTVTEESLQLDSGEDRPQDSRSSPTVPVPGSCLVSGSLAGAALTSSPSLPCTGCCGLGVPPPHQVPKKGTRGPVQGAGGPQEGLLSALRERREGGLKPPLVEGTATGSSKASNRGTCPALRSERMSTA